VGSSESPAATALVIKRAFMIALARAELTPRTPFATQARATNTHQGSRVANSSQI